jgi:hypothetical protein
MEPLSNNLPIINQKVCNFCKTPKETLKKCGRCKSILYCSKKCQIKHWPTHKKVCKKLINDITKKTSAQAKRQICKYQYHCCKNCQNDSWLEQEKTCKFQYNSAHWHILCKQNNINSLITNLTGKKNSLFLKKIVKNPKLSNEFLGCLGRILDTLEKRLDILAQQCVFDQQGQHLTRGFFKMYFRRLEKKGFVKFHPLKFNENGKIEYKEGMKSEGGIVLDSQSDTPLFCNLTSKGKQHLKEIQHIARNVALEMYFLNLIKQKNISFNKILNSEHFETLFKYKKLFLIDNIIFTLLKSKDEVKYQKFINGLEKAYPQNVRIRQISENELNEISKEISRNQIAFKIHISEKIFLLKTFSVENITKKELIELLRSYELI